MDEQLPLRKYIKVWIHRRKNNPKKDGSQTTSYTLEWVEYGQSSFMALGVGATAAYARNVAALKEQELNSLESLNSLEPIRWEDLKKKYLTTLYPGYDLPPKERRVASEKWGKSRSSMHAEKAAIEAFDRIVSPQWCHEINSEDREKFVAQRVSELPSPESVDTDLRSLRLVVNTAIEWKHMAKGSNPFSGRGNATIGTRRKKIKQLSQDVLPKHFTREQIVAILNQVDKETSEKPDDWHLERLKALIYFVAYTGVRLGEALYLEWIDLDLVGGIATINFKIEHGLKTESSENYIGLPDALLPVLKHWQEKKTCRWVFPNSSQKPWTGGTLDERPLGKLKQIAKHAGIAYATWKMFRHSLNTHGKQWFGLSREQMRMQLRHSTAQTQTHYDQVDKANMRGAIRHLDYRNQKD